MSSAVNTLIWLYFQQHHPNLATTFAKEGEFDINQYVELFGMKTIENVVVSSDCRENCKRQRDKDESIVANDGFNKTCINDKNEKEENLQGNASVVCGSTNDVNSDVDKDKVKRESTKNSKKSKRDLCKTINQQDVGAHQTEEIFFASSESTVSHIKNIELGNEVEETKYNDAETTSQSVSKNVHETKGTKSQIENKNDTKLRKSKLNTNAEDKQISIATNEEAGNTNNKLGVKQRFQRIDPTKVRFEAEELKHNLPHDTHLRVRQNQEMMQVKGKNFNKLKQKNKGKFYGAGVDLTVRSYQFPDSDEE